MTAKQKVVKLPEKPSALIRLALRDLEKVERSRKYKVDMTVFHIPNGHCRVCFAGSVMAFTLKVARDFDSSITFDLPEKAKMNALDSARRGDLGAMFEYMGIARPRRLPHFVNTASYDGNPKGFKRDMRKLATLLAKHGC